MPTIFSTKPQLRGRRVVLRPFTSTDIDAMGPVLVGSEAPQLLLEHAFTVTALHRIELGA